jgi:hypothetical protein
MAKPQSPKAPATAPPKPLSFLTTKHSYRVERLSQYEFQAYRATRQKDGSYIEEKFGNPTLFTLVARRLFEAMGTEANEVFQANKTQAKKSDGEKTV